MMIFKKFVFIGILVWLFLWMINLFVLGALLPFIVQNPVLLIISIPLAFVIVMYGIIPAMRTVWGLI